MCNLSLNKTTIEVADFVWNDRDYHLPASELLSTLLILEQSKKPSQPIQDPKIADYLQDQQLVTPCANGEYAVAENKVAEITKLGDKISNAIGEQLDKVAPEFLNLKTTPTIMFMPKCPKE